MKSHSINVRTLLMVFVPPEVEQLVTKTQQTPNPDAQFPSLDPP